MNRLSGVRCCAVIEQTPHHDRVMRDSYHMDAYGIMWTLARMFVRGCIAEREGVRA